MKHKEMEIGAPIKESMEFVEFFHNTPHVVPNEFRNHRKWCKLRASSQDELQMTRKGGDRITLYRNHARSQDIESQQATSQERFLTPIHVKFAQEQQGQRSRAQKAQPDKRPKRGSAQKNSGKWLTNAKN